MYRRTHHFWLTPSGLSARVLGVLLSILGLMVVAAGVWINLLGGSAYHLYTGLGALASGALMVRYRWLGIITLVVALSLSSVWAVVMFEQDTWTLVARLIVPNGFAVALILITPYLTGRHFGRDADLARQAQLFNR